MLQQWPTLGTVVITCAVAHLLLERSRFAWRSVGSSRANAALASSDEATGGASFIEHVVPRDKEDAKAVADIIGAAECASPLARTVASSPHERVNPIARKHASSHQEDYSPMLSTAHPRLAHNR